MTRWSVLWQILCILSLEVISTGLFPLWTPVCPDPWQERPLACVPHGERCLLEMSSWLFCEMYTCPFGKRLGCYSLCLQCICFILRCHVERVRVWAAKAEVNRAYH